MRRRTPRIPGTEGGAMKTIVVGYDETEASKRALERAAELGRAFGSRLTVRGVARVRLGTARPGGPIDPTDTPDQPGVELEHAREFLAAKNIQPGLVPAVGEPAETIVEVAKERNADLIVVGT